MTFSNFIILLPLFPIRKNCKKRFFWALHVDVYDLANVLIYWHIRATFRKEYIAKLIYWRNQPGRLVLYSNFCELTNTDGSYCKGQNWKLTLLFKALPDANAGVTTNSITYSTLRSFRSHTLSISIITNRIQLLCRAQ